MSSEQERRSARRQRYCDHVAAQAVVCIRLGVPFSVRNMRPYPTHPIEPADARLKDSKPICWVALDYAEERAFDALPKAAGVDGLKRLGVVWAAGLVSEVGHHASHSASDIPWADAVAEQARSKLAAYAKALDLDSEKFAQRSFQEAIDILDAADREAWRRVSGEFFERYAPRVRELRELVSALDDHADHLPDTDEDRDEPVE